jgi:predicted RND superfamily exporter protein
MGQSFMAVLSTIYIVAIILVIYHRNVKGLE